MAGSSARPVLLKHCTEKDAFLLAEWPVRALSVEGRRKGPTCPAKQPRHVECHDFCVSAGTMSEKPGASRQLAAREGRLEGRAVLQGQDGFSFWISFTVVWRCFL